MACVWKPQEVLLWHQPPGLEAILGSLRYYAAALIWTTARWLGICVWCTVGGKQKAVQLSGPVVTCGTGCILHACLAWCGVMWCRSGVLRVWEMAWWRAGRPWAWASTAASLAWSPSLWKEPRARVLDVLLSVLLHVLWAYDLLLRAFYVQQPWLKGACHLLTQQLYRPARVQHQ